MSLSSHSLAYELIHSFIHSLAHSLLHSRTLTLIKYEYQSTCCPISTAVLGLQHASPQVRAHLGTKGLWGRLMLATWRVTDSSKLGQETGFISLRIRGCVLWYSLEEPVTPKPSQEE